MTEAEIRAALGIDEAADIGETIKGLQTTVAAQKAVIDTDTAKTEAADTAKLRGDLATARAQLIIEQSENAHKIKQLEESNRQDRVVARVEKAIGREGKPPVMRDQIIEYGMMVDSEALDKFIATIPSIDMTERGVASGSELAELEPTQNEIAVAKQMNIDTASKEWRLGIMREKAKAKGLTLPEGVA
jgi:ribosomal protein L29